MTKPSVPLEERFWSRVQKTDTCWLWTGALAAVSPPGDGYGHFAYQGRHYGAHRYSWELHFGPISDGLEVCHICDVRRCVRPDHLFLGTHADNIRDSSHKGRMHRGEANGIAKLKEPQVAAILRDYQPVRGSIASLARVYGVNEGTVRFIVRRETWRHVKAAS